MDQGSWSLLDWETSLKDLQLLARVAIAVLLAVPLGWDREQRRRPAGLRTHMLVAAATAAFMVLGEAVAPVFAEGGVRADPLRTLEAVVTGLGFLAAGTIFKAEGAVKGLTTAASIWMTAAVALCVGGGRLVLGFGLTVLAVVVLTVLDKLIPDTDQKEHDFESGAGDR